MPLDSTWGKYVKALFHDFYLYSIRSFIKVSCGITVLTLFYLRSPGSECLLIRWAQGPCQWSRAHLLQGQSLSNFNRVRKRKEAWFSYLTYFWFHGHLSYWLLICCICDHVKCKLILSYAKLMWKGHSMIWYFCFLSGFYQMFDFM